MYKKILVPIDGSQTSTRGLAEAVRLAKQQGARLRLVHVVEEYTVIQSAGMGGIPGFAENLIDTLHAEGMRIVDKAVALARKSGIKADAVTYESFSDRCSDIIVNEAKKWRADLIVMGTHGRRGMSRLVLGSDAEIVIRTSPVPVLVVRQPATRARKSKAA